MGDARVTRLPDWMQKHINKQRRRSGKVRRAEECQAGKAESAQMAGTGVAVRNSHLPGVDLLGGFVEFAS